MRERHPLILREWEDIQKDRIRQYKRIYMRVHVYEPAKIKLKSPQQ